MAALVAIQSGAIRLGERDVAALDPRDRARRIGYLPPDASIPWNVSARDVIALGRAQHHAPFAGLSADHHAAIPAALAPTATANLPTRTGTAPPRAPHPRPLPPPPPPRPP